jgi:hypothetical protein
VEAWRKFLLHLAWGGLLAASLPGVVLPTAAQQSTVSENGSGRPVGSDHTVHEPSSAVNSGKQMQELPDSPGIVLSKLNSPFQAQSSNEQQSAVTSSSVAFQRSQPAQSPMVEQAIPQAPQKPVGTATAGTPDASGIAASQPAGVAMAPAKQRRVRTIVLRTGAIIGAGVAVGAVVALTEGTSSRPPGAH